MPFTADDKSAYIRFAQSNKLTAYCVNLTRDRDRAEDLKQQALLRAWAAQDSFAPGTNIEGWIVTIAFRTFVTECRRNKRVVCVGTGEEAGDMNLSHSFARASQIDHVDALAVLDEVARLPAEQAHALLQVALGETYDDVAAKTGVAVGTVKSRVCRARTRVQAVLG